MSARDKQLIQSTDATDIESLRKVANDIFSNLYLRIEALEALKGVTVLPDITFETVGTVARGTKPFNGAMKVQAAGFTPTGVQILSLEKTRGAGAAPAAATSIYWHFASGPNGQGSIVIDYVSGLAINTQYRMRLGVTRA